MDDDSTGGVLVLALDVLTDWVSVLALVGRYLPWI